MKKKLTSDNKIDSTTQLKRARLYLIFSAISLLIAFSLLIGAVIIEQKPRPQTEAIPQQAFSVGTAIRMGDASFQIDNATYTNGTPPFTAPAGKQYLLIDLTVKNHSDKPIQILPTSDTYVKDQAGNVSYVTPSALENPFRAGELSPGEQIKGQLSYLVPKAGTKKFFIDAIWSGGVIPFALP